MFEELTLLAREFRGREHADVIVKIALATAAWVGETSAFDAEDGAALRGFRDF